MFPRCYLKGNKAKNTPYAFSPLIASVAVIRTQSIDLQSKSVDWFLYEVSIS